MKKLTSILLAAGMAMSSVLPLSSSANVDKTYSPTVYFKAHEAENMDILKFGTVFIDRSKMPGVDISFDAELFISDTQKKLGAFTIMWDTDDRALLLSSLTDPITLNGTAPYTAISSATSMNLSHSEENNRMVANLSTFSTSPLTLNFENSDDTSLAGFTVSAGADLSYGCHKVKFLEEERTYLCSLTMRYDDGDFSEKILKSSNIQPLRVNVSDRKLGDINDNEKIDAVDASAVLAAYARTSTNKDSGLSPEQEAAADVNGDGSVNAVDASDILAYYAYTSTIHDDDLNFVEYMRVYS